MSAFFSGVSFIFKLATAWWRAKPHPGLGCQTIMTAHSGFLFWPICTWFEYRRLNNQRQTGLTLVTCKKQIMCQQLIACQCMAIKSYSVGALLWRMPEGFSQSWIVYPYYIFIKMLKRHSGVVFPQRRLYEFDFQGLHIQHTIACT